MADTQDRRDPFVQTLNDKVVALGTTVNYLERDIKDHKVQTEKQFEALTTTINTRFTTIDGKIDKIADAVTGNKISLAKILAWGAVAGLVLSAIVTAIARNWIG